MALKAFIENQIPVDFDKQQRPFYRRFDPEREIMDNDSGILKHSPGKKNKGYP